MDPSLAEAIEKSKNWIHFVPVGQFYPIPDVKEESVVSAAKIAVDKYNEFNHQNLSFVSVVKGQEQMCGGRAYEMVIAVTDGGAHPTKYHVKFWLSRRMRDGDKGCKIDFFKQIEGPDPQWDPPVGTFCPIPDVKADDVVMAAKIVVENYNKLNNRNLSFVSVVKGQQAMVEGPVYDMVIAATDGGAAHPTNYHTEFWLSHWMEDGDKGCIISFFEQIVQD